LHLSWNVGDCQGIPQAQGSVLPPDIPPPTWALSSSREEAKGISVGLECKQKHSTTYKCTWLWGCHAPW